MRSEGRACAQKSNHGLAESIREFASPTAASTMRQHGIYGPAWSGTFWYLSLKELLGTAGVNTVVRKI